MAKLGAYFPKDLIDAYQITRGKVIKIFSNHTNVNKYKRVVIVGIDKDNNLLGVVFINSNTNFNAMNGDQEIIDLQMYIKKENNSFLDKDSFINCAIIFRYSYQEVFDLIKNKPSRILGSVNDDDFLEIISNIKKSPTITKSELQIYKIG